MNELKLLIYKIRRLNVTIKNQRNQNQEFEKLEGAKLQFNL